MSLYWNECRITVSFAMDCPMCHAASEPMVEHVCSNPKPQRAHDKKSQPANDSRAKRQQKRKLK
jgi:hypothetical protein